METKEKTLHEEYVEICTRYVEEFCKKHDYECYEEEYWVGDDAGGVLAINDMFINFDDIRYDIDNNVEEDKFEKWYWKSLDVYEVTGQNYLNYKSYCKGASDNYSDETLERIRELKKKLYEEMDLFKKDIDQKKN